VFTARYGLDYKICLEFILVLMDLNYHQNVTKVQFVYMTAVI